LTTTHRREVGINAVYGEFNLSLIDAIALLATVSVGSNPDFCTFGHRARNPSGPAAMCRANTPETRPQSHLSPNSFKNFLHYGGRPNTWSPPARERRLWLVEQAGDYATTRFHHIRDSTSARESGLVPGVVHAGARLRRRVRVPPRAFDRAPAKCAVIRRHHEVVIARVDQRILDGLQHLAMPFPCLANFSSSSHFSVIGSPSCSTVSVVDSEGRAR
jgi:hypothetical protein